MEIMQPLHALSVHEEMELLGVMVIVYGLMNNVFQKVKLKLPSLNFKIRLAIDPVQGLLKTWMADSQTFFVTLK